MDNPLNSVNGNTTSWMADTDRENATSHKDIYKCDCGNFCKEHEFIHELKMCRECYQDHYGSNYTSIDDAEYLEGSR